MIQTQLKYVVLQNKIPLAEARGFV